MKFVNAAGAGIVPHLILLALTKSGIHWNMHPAQRLSLENLALYHTVTINREVSEQVEKISVSPIPNTLCGIPYVLDDTLDRGWIELRQGGEILARIENLAYPAGTEEL